MRRIKMQRVLEVEDHEGREKQYFFPGETVRIEAWNGSWHKGTITGVNNDALILYGRNGKDFYVKFRDIDHIKKERWV